MPYLSFRDGFCFVMTYMWLSLHTFGFILIIEQGVILVLIESFVSVCICTQKQDFRSK